MSLPEDPPPATSIQNLYDETQRSKPSVETTKPNNHINVNIELYKNIKAPSTTKHNNQNFISELVMLTKNKNESINNNDNHEGTYGNC